MRNSKIFLVGEDDCLVPMTETSYVAEGVLQDLLARYPDLLPGDQIDPENPRRWLLVSREMGVPDDMAEAGRWSLDHLFLDQDGIPTFVECKRATDTRSRREVVAQMLDYAANGVEYWSVDQIRQAATSTAQKQGKLLEDELGRLLDDDSGEFASYWAQVGANLENRRIRLLFVMDMIPKELRRLVEFLNEQMTRVDVLAVEVKQFQSEIGKGRKTLVPRVIGLTETARSIKQPPPTPPRLTLDEFGARCDPEAVPFFERVIERARQHGYQLYLGTQSLSVRAVVEDHRASFLYCTPPSRFSFYFDGGWRSLLSEEQLAALREKLLSFDVLEQSGQWTLPTTVTKENVARLNELCDLIYDEMGRILRK